MKGVAANTGHISTHEAGAIECGGHKVLELPGKEGKLQLAELRNYLQQFYADPLHEHTESVEGTLYVGNGSPYVCHRHSVVGFLYHKISC